MPSDNRPMQSSPTKDTLCQIICIVGKKTTDNTQVSDICCPEQRGSSLRVLTVDFCSVIYQKLRDGAVVVCTRPMERRPFLRIRRGRVCAPLEQYFSRICEVPISSDVQLFLVRRDGLEKGIPQFTVEVIAIMKCLESAGAELFVVQ